jgi:alkylation response protein AidB-like acyl-CoA dehydrogenase
MTAGSDLLEAVAAGAADRERAGSLEPDLVDRMRSAGVFSMLVPASLGGGEAEPADLVATVESIAAADGSAGWCAGVGATAGLVAAYLPEVEARELFADPPRIAAGVFAPRGRLEAAGDGTYRLSGRWPLASGIDHARVVGLGAIDSERGPLYAAVACEDVEVEET